MKKTILTLALLLFATTATAGSWHKCDDINVLYRGKTPPSKSVSFSSSATAEDYAAAGWCTDVYLVKPEVTEGNKLIKATPVINYPYTEIGWVQIPDPNYETPAEKLEKIKKDVFVSEVEVLEEKAKKDKYKTLEDNINACVDMDCLYALGLDVLPAPEPVDIPVGTY